MSYEQDKTNRGTLSYNDNKTKSTQPDMRGTVNVNGIEYWVSAWDKPGPNGQFFSLSFTVKDVAAALNKPRNNKPKQ
jgi:hypothetical protein